MIKVIYFDVGRVLIKTLSGDVNENAARILKVPPDKLLVVFRRHINKVAEGKLSEANFWKIIGREFRASNEQIKKLLLIFKKRRVGIQRHVLAIAKRLKKNSYQVGILSDVIPTHAKIIRKTGLYKNFSPVLLSYKTGISKRRLGAYRLAARRARVRPTEMIFFDDHKYLVLKAKKLGIKAFVYKNPTQLVRSLKRFGVKI